MVKGHLGLGQIGLLKKNLQELGKFVFMKFLIKFKNLKLLKRLLNLF